MEKKLENYLNHGVSPFHAAAYAVQRLREEGFEKLTPGDMKKLQAGQGYYMSPYPSMFFAFRVQPGRRGMHLAMAHTDSPSFLVKPNPQLEDRPYMKINVEPYGGMLKRTWFDRPLGLAGRVIIKNDEDVFSPEEVLFDSRKPWLVIPSLAPHLDREIETSKIDAQKVLIPLYGVRDGEAVSIKNRIAQEMNIEEGAILSYELYLYNTDKATHVGIDGDLLLSPRIDNLASVAALTEAIIGADESAAGVSLAACFDNEEIGSRTKQGADSGIFKAVIEDIYRRLGKEDELVRDYAESMMLSVDGAHAVHPNYRDKSDVTAKVVLGGGVVVKSSASQRYVTDAKASAILLGLGEARGIKIQQQANRSGAPGGQTLGPIASSYLPILAADIGIPMLAMHSANELAMYSDCEELYRLLHAFF